MMTHCYSDSHAGADRLKVSRARPPNPNCTLEPLMGLYPVVKSKLAVKLVPKFAPSQIEKVCPVPLSWKAFLLASLQRIDGQM